jgi:tetratricopeptide (TPR) repeat protein
MLLTPISEAVTKDASHSKYQCAEPWILNAATFFLLLVLLAAWPGRACAQQAAPQFDDLAVRAAAARDSGNLPQAIELYGQAEELKPDWAEGWFYSGLLEYSSNSFPAAIDAFNHFLQLQPGAPPALALRGLSEFETGAYDDALRDLEEGVAKGAANDPHNEQIVRYHLAQLLTRAGRFEDALAQYQFFAAKHIDDPDLMIGIGLAGLRVASLSKDIAADDRELYQTAGSAGYALLSGDNEEADRLFSQLFTRYPKMAGLHFYYGFLLFPHAPELSIDQFRGEVALAPANLYAHAMLAYSLMIGGHYADAVPEAELALAGSPGMQMAQLALGRSLAETGEVKRGTEVLNQVLEKDPNNLEAHIALAALYARTGRKEDAYRERMVCLGLAK